MEHLLVDLPTKCKKGNGGVRVCVCMGGWPTDILKLNN